MKSSVDLIRLMIFLLKNPGFNFSSVTAKCFGGFGVELESHRRLPHG